MYICCIVISIYMEYRAVITILVPIRIIVRFDHEKVDITTNSSLIRLIVGGRPGLLGLLIVIKWLLVGGEFAGLGLRL